MSKTTPESNVFGENLDYRTILQEKAQLWINLLMGRGIYRGGGFPILFPNEMVLGKGNPDRKASEEVHILLTTDINSRMEIISGGVIIVTLGISISFVEPPFKDVETGRERMLKFRDGCTIYFNIRRDGWDYRVEEGRPASYGDLRFFNSILKDPALVKK